MISALLVAGSVTAFAQERPDDELLRQRIESRYEVVSLSDGIALRPRPGLARARGIRFIEITNGTVTIDGDVVTGGELKQRLGDDADAILRLTYLTPQQRRALFLTAERPSVAEAPGPSPEPRGPTETPDRRLRRVGDRVRIFGNVNVDRDERVDGQVVAVLGSVRIEGEVADQVVAVLGSVTLGPEARVRGDVVTVGGAVHRAQGAEVGGSIHEVSFASPGAHIDFTEIPWWGPWWVMGPFGGAVRLFGTIFRLTLLVLLAWIVALVAQEPTARIAYRARAETFKAGLIGLLAELLFLPLLVTTTIVLALTILGIPLLLLMPFVVIGMIFVLIAGFAGAAYAVGQWITGRPADSTRAPLGAVALGVLLVLAPLVASRIVGLVGGMYVFAFVLAVLGVLVEYLVWTVGFGAALMIAFDRWTARRAAAPPTAPVAAADDSDIR